MILNIYHLKSLSFLKGEKRPFVLKEIKNELGQTNRNRWRIKQHLYPTKIEVRFTYTSTLFQLYLWNFDNYIVHVKSVIK